MWRNCSVDVLICLIFTFSKPLLSQRHTGADYYLTPKVDDNKLTTSAEQSHRSLTQMALFLRVATTSRLLLHARSRGQNLLVRSFSPVAGSYYGKPIAISNTSHTNCPPMLTSHTRQKGTWTSTSDALESVVVTPVTGAILPFANLNFLQVCLLPVTYGVMYYTDFLLNFMPWWGAILGTTVTLRLLLFPAYLKQHIVGIKSHNILPETQRLQASINDALSDGDHYNISMNRAKLNLLHKEHDLTMLQRLGPSLIQVPFYMTVFFLFRQLSQLPVESLTTGGIAWFSNLTVPDPYYILPALTSATMLAIVEFGFKISPQAMTPMGRYIMRAFPVGLFFLVKGFPASITLFWSATNLVTLIFNLMFNQQWVCKKLNIPDRLKHNMDDLPLAKQTFLGQMRSAVEKSKGKHDASTLRRLDAEAFRKAAVGPIPKTYKEPPRYASHQSKTK